MNSEEKFKELLQEKLTEKEFSFNEKHWGSMRDMIDESRDKKGRRLILFLLCLVCMTGTVVLYTFTDTAKTTYTQVRVEKNKQETSEPHDPTSRVTNEEASLTASEQTEPKALTSLPLQRFQSSGEHPASNIPEGNGISREKTVSRSTEQPDGKNNLTPENPLAIQESTHYSNSGTPLVLPLALQATNFTEELNTKGALTQTPPEITNDPVSKAETDKDIPEKTVLAENELNEPKTEPVVSVESTTILNTPAIALDSAVTASPVVAEVILPIAPHPPKHTVWIEGGTNYLAGWKEKNQRDARGFNLIAGMGYQTAINHQFALSAGVQYTSVRNLSAYSHSSTATSYGFGEKKDVTIITPEKIHYVQVPVKLHILLSANNSIGVGYTLGYLVTVNSKVETYGNSVNYQTERTVTNTNGYIQGFNKFDSQVSVFYKRMVLKNLFVNAEMIYGLTDTKQNHFVRTNVFERNMGFKLTIGYTIFQK